MTDEAPRPENELEAARKMLRYQHGDCPAAKLRCLSWVDHPGDHIFDETGEAAPQVHGSVRRPAWWSDLHDETTNNFLVGARGDKVALINPPVSGQEFSRECALRLAAWLVVAAGDYDGAQFALTLKAVTQT